MQLSGQQKNLIYRYKFDANRLYSYSSLKGRQNYVEDTDRRR